LRTNDFIWGKYETEIFSISFWPDHKKPGMLFIIPPYKSHDIIIKVFIRTCPFQAVLRHSCYLSSSCQEKIRLPQIFIIRKLGTIVSYINHNLFFRHRNFCWKLNLNLILPKGKICFINININVSWHSV